ncbi:PLDc N-terminal domain-containing protein [Leucobacter luti]|uniref:PLDc N-terminal domain-containing protein n=1 Tax=Leucobacter luti TaxID=340320 RepID=UPI001C68870B|nr:PLDc N-terminal domain-containing protein [Leucobacter luti]QYM75140.1 PLDc N-terminal domain-containing protein [Leucobacter luti]
MVRFVIIGIVIAVAFTLYALVDAAMTDGSRARGVSKPVWVLIVVVLPVIGGVLWFLIGKGQPRPPVRQSAPDDDPRFTATRLSDADLDAHMRDLEDRLRELDSETFPGEEPVNPVQPSQDRSEASDTDAADAPETERPAMTDDPTEQPKAPEPGPRDPDRREGGTRADGDAPKP